MTQSLLRKIAKSLSIFCAICIIYSSLSFYEIYSEEKAVLSTLRSQVAVVYAGPTFHDEVASVVACILHNLGYYVVVYIGNGVHFAGMMIPFSGRRKRNSQKFYGSCVSQFVTITSAMKFVDDPDVMVFVTYPMMQHAGQNDKHAISLLKKIQKESSTTSVILVTHRTNEMINPMMYLVESIIPRNQTTYMFLGEHTFRTAKKLINNHDSIIAADKLDSKQSKNANMSSLEFKISDDPSTRNVSVGDPATFQISYFYPVLPRGHIANMGHGKFLKLDGKPEYFNESSYHVLNSRHYERNKKRRTKLNEASDFEFQNKIVDINRDTVASTDEISDHKLVLKNNTAGNLTSNIEHREIGIERNEVLQRKDMEEISDDYDDDYNGDDITYHPLFVMQGNFGGKHAHRKDPKGILNCLRKIENDIKTESIKKRTQNNDKINEIDESTKKTLETIEKMSFMRNLISDEIGLKIELNSVSNKSHSLYIKNTDINSVINATQSKTGIEDEKGEKTKIRNKKQINKLKIEKETLSMSTVKEKRTFSPVKHSSKSVSIDLVGHLSGKVDIGKLRTGEVRFLSDLGSKDYYLAISKARFMLAAIGEKEYFTSRATSSVPAALIAEVPLVTGGAFLNVYPCLRDAPIHRMMAWGRNSGSAVEVGVDRAGPGRGGADREGGGYTVREDLESNRTVRTSRRAHTDGNTECEAMQIAVSLTSREYALAKKEIEDCSTILWNNAKESFSSAINKNSMTHRRKQKSKFYEPTST